jgi:hypothetical protein
MPRTVRRPYPSVVAWLRATGTRQEDLARQVGIKPAHFSNVIRKKRSCSFTVALKLSKICNVPIETIASDAQISGLHGK